MKRASSTAGNASEMAHFAQLASSWWDPRGSQRILHKMNLMRMDFIRDTLHNNRAGVPGYSLDLLPKNNSSSSLKSTSSTFKPNKMDCLDIGCGGGLLSESLARLPHIRSVLGVDVTPEVISVAREHKMQDPLLHNLEYRLQNAGSLDPRDKQYDLVTMFEVMEHLDSPAKDLDTAISLVKPGGWLFLSTINRTVAAYLSTILLGEYVLKVVPPGTHSWAKYINKTEIVDYLNAKHPNLQLSRVQGCIYVPTQGWIRFDPMSKPPHLRFLNCAIGQDGGNYLMALYKHK